MTQDTTIQKGKDTLCEVRPMEGEEHVEATVEEIEEGEEVKTSALEELVCVDSLQQELEVARSEAAEYYDRWIRLAAEFDNYKKRMSRQFEEVIRGANEHLLEQLLPVLDNLERALDHAQQEQNNTALFAQGVQLILDQFKNVLAQAGLQVMEAEGQPFDPELYDAVMQMESSDHDPGRVMQIVEQGYMLNDRVLRHAKVVVSR